MNTVQTEFISTKYGSLAYRKYGAGEKVLLCFHGFALDKTAFLPLVDLWSDEYTFYSFDLYFHGESEKEFHGKINPKDWQLIIDDFLKQHQILRFDLLGYSIGARFALSIIESHVHYIDKVFLIAPDGIYKNFMYQFLTTTSVGRYLFSTVVDSPKFVRALIITLRKLRLISRALYVMFLKRFRTYTARKQVMYAWVSFTMLGLNSKRLCKVLATHPTLKTHFFLTPNDAFITYKPFFRDFDAFSNAKITLFKAYHDRLIAQTALYFQNLKTTIDD